MKLTRKDFLKSAAAAALVAPFGGVREAFAQEYPSQDIRLICGFPAGSGADIFVRYFAEKLRPISGRSVIVENKVGANSNVATEFVARSKPDGHTLYPFAGTTVAATHGAVQESAGRRRQVDHGRRDDEQSWVHARGGCEEPLQERRRVDRRQ